MNTNTVNGLDKIVVIAVGGNALASEEGQTDLESQAQAAVRTATHIVDVALQGYKVVLTHGNGPQVGFILRRSELAKEAVPIVPMDYATADTQGAIGFMFQRAIDNEFRRRGIQQTAQALVTQVIVDQKDSAFSNPTKPIGSYMDEAKAKQLAAENNWHIMEDAGRGWRRCVPSPKPQSVVEIDAILQLLASNMVVIAAGGGGIPVIERADRTLKGVEAVIDKDLSSCLLAKQLHAEKFIVATAVEKVAINFGKPNQASLATVSAAQMTQYAEEGHFPAGSMGPKVAAVVDFVVATQQTALITDIAHLAAALKGEAGTHVKF